MTDAVRLDVTDATAILTLDRPERLNAVDEPMLRTLAEHLRRLDADPDVRVIALTGQGRGFCSGAALSPDALGADTKGDTLTAVGEVARALIRARTPTVALVNGVAAGAGCSMALACGYVLATESAWFSLAFSGIGLMPDGGGTALLAASIGRARATRLALTGERLDAGTAHEWGLIAQVAPDAEFAERSREVLGAFAAGPTRALGATVFGINAASLDIDAALAVEERGQTELLDSEDFAEGVTAFAAKRRPVFRGR